MVGFFVRTGQLMKITTSVTEGGVALLEVEGSVNAHTAPLLSKTLTDLLTQGHSRLVIDASHIEYLSSTGLRVLLYVWRDARQLGGDVRLCGANAAVRRIVELAGFEELLYNADTCQEAMQGW
jgi:anti-sigma B factor antagonist